jgi:hypothetical protein
MPAGMCATHVSIGRPKMRVFTPCARKCAASDKPYGPAPTMTTSDFTGCTPKRSIGLGKDFFFEKKKQKTFESLSRSYPVVVRQFAKSFWFFFSKETMLA